MSIDRVPLTTGQRSLYRHHKFHPGDTAYNLTNLTLISGPLDVARFTTALESAVDASDSLRMDFVEEAGVAYGRVDRRRGPQLRLVNRPQGMSEEEFIGEIHSAAWKLQNSAPAQQWPFYSLSLHVVSETVAYVLSSVPHLIIDAIGYWSWLQAVSASYNSGVPCLQDGGSPTPEADAARSLRRTQREARTHEYFARELRGLESLEVPAIVQGRDSSGGIPGRVVSFDVPREVVDPLLAAKRLSPSQFFFSVYALLLRRLIPVDGLVVGYAVPDRTPETMRAVGCFVNTAPTVLDIPLQTTFSSMTAAVGQKLFRLHRYQGYDPDAFPSLAPRMSCLFTFYEREFSYALDGCVCTSLPIARVHLPAEIRLTVETRSGTYRPVFDLGRYFDDVDVEKEFRKLVEAVVSDPEVALSAIPLSESRVRGGELDPRLCGDATQTRPATASRKHVALSLSHELEAIAARYPHRPAVSCAGAIWTYEDLNAQANRIASVLGAVAGGCQNVVVSVERSGAAIPALLAILKLGKCYVPIDPHTPTERWRHVVDELESPFVIADHTPPVAADGIALTDLVARATACSAENPGVVDRSEESAYIIYTSGSTGLPKGVSISHRNLLSLIRACDLEFDFGPDDVWTLFHSLSFDFSIWETFGCLLHGGKLVIVDSATTQDPERFYQLACHEKVTVMNHTPSVFKNVIREDELRRGALAPRYVFLGGEALHFGLLREWVDRHPLSACRIVNLYGPTEATILATTYQLSGADLKQERSVIGRPIGGSAIDIRMPDGTAAVPGVPGEIVISGAGVAKGYYKRGQAADAKFGSSAGRPEFRTGDLGRVRSDDTIEFLGRIDRQVKIRGFRVELAEIESALRNAGMVDCALDLVRFDGDPRLVAYVLPPTGGFSERQLREVLRHTLPAYMIPSVFVEIGSIPTTVNGKVDFTELSKIVRSRPTDAKGDTDTERWLFALVAARLKHDRFDVTDNLLDIGLASLDIVELVSSLRAAGRTSQLGVLDVFEYPTIRALGGHLDLQLATAPQRERDREDDGRAGKRHAMLAVRRSVRPETTPRSDPGRGL
jgi:amino acid adenylation domain-containing protein